jgi:hypothetical protein
MKQKIVFAMADGNNNYRHHLLILVSINLGFFSEFVCIWMNSWPIGLYLENFSGLKMAESQSTLSR